MVFMKKAMSALLFCSAILACDLAPKTVSPEVPSAVEVVPSTTSGASYWANPREGAKCDPNPCGNSCCPKSLACVPEKRSTCVGE